MEHSKINKINNYTKALKHPCAFIMTIKPPMQTLEKICELLAQKEIKVDTMQLGVQDSGDGKLVIHCEIEKDRVAYIGRHLEKMNGVKTIDWMHARTREKLY